MNWVACATVYICHEQKPPKQYVLTIHLPARAKENLIDNYYQPHRQSQGHFGKAPDFVLNLIVALQRPPLGCLSSGGRMVLGGFSPPLL